MKDDPKRLWDRAEQVGECLVWRGARSDSGYGLLMWHGERRRRAHRVAYELVKGPVPPGLHVLHHCDNPPCIRPDHLFVGTQNDNLRDMRMKQRAAAFPIVVDQRGAANRAAKYTDREVLAVRALVEAGVAQGVVARAFGMSHASVSLIVARKRWGHI